MRQRPCTFSRLRKSRNWWSSKTLSVSTLAASPWISSHSMLRLRAGFCLDASESRAAHRERSSPVSEPSGFTLYITMLG
jgi:hypothetical protein